jgi:hypothetical protein
MRLAFTALSVLLLHCDCVPVEKNQEPICPEGSKSSGVIAINKARINRDNI